MIRIINNMVYNTHPHSSAVLYEWVNLSNTLVLILYRDKLNGNLFIYRRSGDHEMIEPISYQRAHLLLKKYISDAHARMALLKHFNEEEICI